MDERIQAQLQEFVNDYLKETETPLTVDEVMARVDAVYPIIDETTKTLIGMFGVTVAESAYYNESIPSVRMIYVKPDERKPTHFKEITKTIFSGLKEAGFTKVELSVNRKINNWMRKVLWSKPNLFTHFGNLDDFIGRL